MALMVKPALVAEVRLGLLADRVYVPAVLMVRLLKVATPFCGVAVNVPARPVPPTRASVTGFAAVVTTLPLPSSTDTVDCRCDVALSHCIGGLLLRTPALRPAEETLRPQ